MTKKNQPILQIHELVKQFHTTVAVDNITLDIERGEIFALLGSSGSGKSTLLRLLAGFEKPTAGKIYLDGINITDLPPYLRPINMMFQSYALFPHMTVENNIAFGLKQDRLSKQEIKEQVAHMMDIVDMTRYAKRKPAQLSGGQQQRVALARSLAKRPNLLLLDEPMGALDKQLRTRMQLELVNIIHRVGVTCLIVTHDQEEAMAIADRVGIMDQGWIVQTGSPIDVYESPNCKMTAEFIGSVNLFEGTIIDDTPDHVTIKSSELDTLIQLSHGISVAQENRNIWVAIRPEKTKLFLQQPNESYNWSKGSIKDIAYLGTHSIYYIELTNGKKVQSLHTNTERRVEKLEKEAIVYISWDASCPLVLNE